MMEQEELQRTIGDRCRKARLMRGLSQEELAIKLGMSPEGYAKVERGLVMPNMETFARIVEVLDVLPSALLGHTGLEARSGTLASKREVRKRRRLARIEQAVRADPLIRQAVSDILKIFERLEKS